MRIAPGIHRIGNGMVNSYLIEDAGAVAIVDAGLPGYWRALPGELEAMGRTLADVSTVLLTHAHTDHLGFAERARTEGRIPVRVHELDAALARGEVRNPRSLGMRPFSLGAMLRFLAFAARNGVLRTPTVRVVSTFGDGATLDAPGSPRVVAIPGHTPGSAALHLPARDALFIGDAFVTYAVTTGMAGPALSPFNADRATALASLARLDGLEAGLVLPGHGEPWTGGLGEALATVRAAAGAGGTQPAQKPHG